VGAAVSARSVTWRFVHIGVFVYELSFYSSPHVCLNEIK